MQRRSFLTLLVAAPFVPALAKLEAIMAPVAAPAFVPSAELIIERFCLAMACEMVEPGRIGRIVAMPQTAFRPDRLIVAPCSEKFELLHVAASGEPQLEMSIPADVFGADRFGIRLAFSTVPAGDQIVLAVRNMGTEPAPFVATFLGNIARPPYPGELERQRAELDAIDFDAISEFGDDDDPAEDDYFDEDDDAGQS